MFYCKFSEKKSDNSKCESFRIWPYIDCSRYRFLQATSKYW